MGGIFVKICGITRMEDSLSAVRHGAAAIGFIAYPKSQRYLSAKDAESIVSKIPGNVLKVGVFVNAELAEIRKYIDSGINVLQLHGDETAEFAEKLAKFAEVWKAIRPKTKDDVLRFENFPASKFLIDAFSETSFGGTGSTCNWEIAKFAVDTLEKPVILAGGIGPDNVEDAVLKVHPFGLDVNSRLEKAPGIKDEALLEELFRRVNCADSLLP